MTIVPPAAFAQNASIGFGFQPDEVAPDGRFLIIRSGQAETGGTTAPTLILVQNRFEELKRLVPTK